MEDSENDGKTTREGRNKSVQKTGTSVPVELMGGRGRRWALNIIPRTRCKPVMLGRERRTFAALRLQSTHLT